MYTIGQVKGRKINSPLVLDEEMALEEQQQIPNREGLNRDLP